jgi:hypothetical protein
MDIADEMQEIETEDEISPIIQIFERLTFERGHEVHDQVSAMIELFSLSEVSLASKHSSTSVFLSVGNIRNVRHVDRMRENHFCQSIYK